MNPRYALWVSLAALTMLAGCASALPRDSRPVPTGGNAELMSHIADSPYVTSEAGYRAARIVWRGAPFEGDYAALSAELEQGGLIGDWDLGATDYLRRYQVGQMLCVAAGIKTGVNWNMTGFGRYGYRELVFHEIAEPRGDYGLIPGGEFAGILRRLDDWTARRDGTRVELGPEKR
ncbi:MAG: hypothetical protein KDA32_04140 [Phycisphaerales bacterium]|nr:hypothetical protein [Phycisphaerales bacterium]